MGQGVGVTWVAGWFARNVLTASLMLPRFHSLRVRVFWSTWTREFMVAMAAVLSLTLPSGPNPL